MIADPNVWTMDVAIEHENDFKSWIYEVKQQMLVDAKLRVIISYSDPLNLSTVSFKEALIEEALQVFELFSSVYKYYPNSFLTCTQNEPKEFLIILGNKNSTINKLNLKLESVDESYFGYRPYLFKIVNKCLAMYTYDKDSDSFIIHK